MKKPITIIKAPTMNNSFDEDRFSDRFSDKISLPDRYSDRLSLPDNTKFPELTQNSLDRLRSLTFKKIVKNLSLCGDEQLTNNTFDDHMSCPISQEYQGVLLNPSLIHLFKSERDLRDFLQEQKSKYDQAMLKYQDRQTKIQRYKNKKRIWERAISYGCRKIVADNRLRIKGRFISKKDTDKISSLVQQSDVKDMFDAKRNLDIDKFNTETRIFRQHANPRFISKRQILNTITDEADFKREQQNVQKRISENKPLWNLVYKKVKLQKQELEVKV